MEYQYKIAGHLCRIAFCDTVDGLSLLPSFPPFANDEEGEFALPHFRGQFIPVDFYRQGSRAIRLRREQIRCLSYGKRKLPV